MSGRRGGGTHKRLSDPSPLLTQKTSEATPSMSAMVGFCVKVEERTYSGLVPMSP